MTCFRHSFVVLAAVSCMHAGAQTASASSGGSIAESNAAVFKACARAPKTGKTCPLDAVFGLFKLAPNNDVLDFKASTTVPRVIDQNYGWTMKVNRKSGKARVLERMTLPEAPRSWGAGGQPYGTTADRKTISLDVTLTIYNGSISKSWDVADGDPPGHYVITAYIEDSAPVRFEFDVVNPR